MGNLALSAQLAVPVGMRPTDEGDVPWYMLAGTPLAAYQPKGAASQAASYINMVNPGVHDLAVGNAPAWAANTGWTFTRASSHYLISTIVPGAGYSALVQISGVPTNGIAYCALGCTQAASSKFFGIFPNNGAVGVGYHMGDALNVAPNVAVANLGLAGQQGYRNGVADGGAIGNTNGIPTIAFYIGVRNGDGTAQATTYLTGTITALVVYSTTLTAGQMATVAAAMAAL